MDAGRLVIDGRRLVAERTGVGRYLEALLRAWADRPPWPAIVIVLQDRNGAGRIPAADGLHVRVIGEGLPGLVWEELGLGRVLRRGDVLFAPTNLIPRSWRGPSVLVAFDTLLETVPGGFTRSVRWRFRPRYRSAARRATRIVVPSEATRRDVLTHYGVPEGRIRVVYPAVGDEFRPREQKDPEVLLAREAVGLGDAGFFLFVGKRSRRRNVPAILDGFARHRDRFPSDRLVFVGPPGGDPDPARRAGVIVAGHVPDAVLTGLLSGALGLLYPSDYEGFGLPVIEAMASGCPVITLRNSALVESAGEAAIFLGRPGADDLAVAMAALTVEDVRRSFVGPGLEQAARFRGTRFADEVAGVIREVAGLAQPDGAG